MKNICHIVLGCGILFAAAFLPADSLAKLKGVPGLVESHNKIADNHNLLRMKDGADIRRHAKTGYLVRVKSTSNFYIDPELPIERRYACPEAVAYLDVLGAAYRAKFGSRLKATSLVRTPASQRRLVRRGRSTADGHRPERRSTHLTGMAFDISIKNLSRTRVKWLGDQLLIEREAGHIGVIYEPSSNNFHVMVFPQ